MECPCPDILLKAYGVGNITGADTKFLRGRLSISFSLIGGKQRFRRYPNILDNGTAERNFRIHDDVRVISQGLPRSRDILDIEDLIEQRWFNRWHNFKVVIHEIHEALLAFIRDDFLKNMLAVGAEPLIHCKGMIDAVTIAQLQRYLPNGLSAEARFLKMANESAFYQIQKAQHGLAADPRKLADQDWSCIAVAVTLNPRPDFLWFRR